MAIKRGTAGSDSISGTSLADDLYGLGGADTLKGLAGNDRLWGGTGIDALFGSDGRDQLYGEAGNDYLEAGNDADFVHGGSGFDRLRGGAGDDTLNGGSDSNDVRGGTGNDTIILEATGVQKGGNSLLMGESGTDMLRVNADAATLSTNGGIVPAYVGISVADGTLSFNNGTGGDMVEVGKFSGIEKFTVADNTQLYFIGGNLNTTVTGSSQDDVMIFGAGNETFDGRGGADDFVIFSNSGDVDRLVNFDAAKDQVWSDIWFNSNGDPIANRIITETGGETIVTTSTFAGETVHTLHIDAVGIPPDVFRDWGTYPA